MLTQNFPTIKDIIRTQLKDLGYYKIDVNKEQADFLEIIADGDLRSIFLQVKVTPVSQHNNYFSKIEIDKIKHGAAAVKKEPWAAVVKIGMDGELIEGIQWTNLSKKAS